MGRVNEWQATLDSAPTKSGPRMTNYNPDTGKESPCSGSYGSGGGGAGGGEVSGAGNAANDEAQSLRAGYRAFVSALKQSNAHEITRELLNTLKEHDMFLTPPRAPKKARTDPDSPSVNDSFHPTIIAFSDADVGPELVNGLQDALQWVNADYTEAEENALDIIEEIKMFVECTGREPLAAASANPDFRPKQYEIQLRNNWNSLWSHRTEKTERTQNAMKSTQELIQSSGTAARDFLSKFTQLVKLERENPSAYKTLKSHDVVLWRWRRSQVETYSTIKKKSAEKQPKLGDVNHWKLPYLELIKSGTYTDADGTRKKATRDRPDTTGLSKFGVGKCSALLAASFWQVQFVGDGEGGNWRSGMRRANGPAPPPKPEALPTSDLFLALARAGVRFVDSFGLLPEAVSGKNRQAEELRKKYANALRVGSVDPKPILRNCEWTLQELITQEKGETTLEYAMAVERGEEFAFSALDILLFAGLAAVDVKLLFRVDGAGDVGHYAWAGPQGLTETDRNLKVEPILTNVTRPRIVIDVYSAQSKCCKFSHCRPTLSGEWDPQTQQTWENPKVSEFKAMRKCIGPG